MDLIKRLDDIMLLTLGATAIALLILAISYTNTYEVQAKEVTDEFVLHEADEQCAPSEYAHIPYPDEYEFICVGNTMEIWDAAEGEYITSEIRGTANMVQAEDGSYVPADFWESEED
jgi:hypothetical protein